MFKFKVLIWAQDWNEHQYTYIYTLGSACICISIQSQRISFIPCIFTSEAQNVLDEIPKVLNLANVIPKEVKANEMYPQWPLPKYSNSP